MSKSTPPQVPSPTSSSADFFDPTAAETGSPRFVPRLAQPGLNGPRKQTVCICATTGKARLQRGNRQFSHLCHDWHSLASTGVRGLSTAETACFDRLTALTNRLQWGCGLSTAESGGRALLNSTSLGCNPVATQPQLTWAGSTLKPHSVHSGVPLVTDPFSQ
jgi:hypothetical protein